MTHAQAQALALMQARNAALTPDERKARSAKAAAASAAAAKARKAAVGPFPTGANRAPQPPAPRPSADLPVVAYVYTCTFKRPDSGVEALVHVPVEAQTPRRALKQGRRLASEQAPEGTSFGAFVALARADSLDFTKAA